MIDFSIDYFILVSLKFLGKKRLQIDIYYARRTLQNILQPSHQLVARFDACLIRCLLTCLLTVFYTIVCLLIALFIPCLLVCLTVYMAEF